MVQVAQLGLSVFGAVQGAQQQKNLAAAARGQASVEEQSRRLQSVREARVARGRAVNAAANQGSGDSSTQEGIVAGINQQLNENLSSIQQNSIFASSRYKTQQQQINSQETSDIAGAFIQFATSAASGGSNPNAG